MQPNYYYYCLFLLFLSCSSVKKTINIGHRGAMGHETQNTVASIKKAMEIGVDMIEIDVFIIKSEILPWLGTTDLIYKDFDGNNRDFIWHEKKDRTAQIIATNKK